MPGLSNGYDLVVIGGGPGGYAAGIRASQLGMKVALVERERAGGTCLNWGCIPTKSLIRNAEVLSLFRRASEFGITCGEVSADFSAAVARSRVAVGRLTKGVEYLLKKNGVTTIAGHGRLTREKSVAVSDPSGRVIQEVRGGRTLIATGSTSKAMPGVDPDGDRIITSAEALVLDSLPRSMVILGGGVIAVEFAYILAVYGVEITIVEMLPSIIPNEDREVAEVLAGSLRRRGIQIRTGTKVDGVDRRDGELRVRVSGGDGEAETLRAEKVLVALGRGPYTEGLGLEEVGLETDRGFIKVNEDYRTSAEGIYAVGDVIPTPLLAHVATAEGVTAVERMCGDEEASLNYRNIPNCIYCQPQVASTGLTEEAARQGHDVKVGRFPFRALGKAVVGGEEEGMVKLVVDAKYGELLGAHIVGSDASEMIAEVVLARGLEATTTELGRTIHAHPTLHEAILEAALAAEGRAIHI